jgi:MFS family permease
VAAVSLVPLMVFRRDPLVPPSLFKSRNFSVTNVSTVLIYGALYVFSYYLALFLQSTLGYTALGSGLAGLPTGLALALLSTSFGHLAGRLGPRRFMAIGPALMALGLLWFVRIPADSQAWAAAVNDPSSLVPPVAYLTDVLPANLLFAFGIAMLVAPLTTALMTSVPVGNSGLASAINNALSRIGPILAGAVIFIGVTASFYGGLAEQVPSLDVNSAEVRAAIPPIQSPADDLPDEVKQAARESSTDAFHLAMLIAALLCAAGAAVNWIGIVDPEHPERATATQAAASGA